MATIWSGFLLGIGLMLAVAVVALAPFLFRLVIFCSVALVALVVAALCLMITWHLLLDPWTALWAALPIVVTFGWIPCLVLVYFGFDRFMVWLRNNSQRQRDFAHRLETDLHDAGYYLPRREPQLLPPSKK
jgi:H+/gluconate symporter-like permease